MRATLRSTRLVEGVVCQSPLSTVPATALVWFEEVLKLYILDFRIRRFDETFGC